MHSTLFFFYILPLSTLFLFFFFNDTATTEIYTLSLHDALPISYFIGRSRSNCFRHFRRLGKRPPLLHRMPRSEEHTSELQSPDHLVCRLLLEKKKKQIKCIITNILRSILLVVDCLV